MPYKNEKVYVNNNAWHYARTGDNSTSFRLDAFSVSSIELLQQRSQGVSSPGYRLAISKHVSATSVLTGTKETLRSQAWATNSGYTLGSDASRSDAFKSNGDTGMLGVRVNGVGGTFNTKAESVAVIDFSNKVRNTLGTFDAGSFLGELNETLRMIRKPLQGGVKLYSKYKKAATELHKEFVRRVRKRRYGLNIPPSAYWGSERKWFEKELHSLYLEFTFGWKPLLHDIDAGIQALADYKVNVQSKRIYTKYRVDDPGSGALHLGPWNYYWEPRGLFGMRYRTMVSSSCVIKGSVSLKTTLTSSRAAVASQKMQGGLENFIPTIYNLIPFSFVVDYFSNLGDFIGGISADLTPLQWVNTTNMVEVTTNGGLVLQDPVWSDGTTKFHGKFTGGSFQYSGRSFHRKPGLKTWSTDGLVFKMPSLKQALNLGVLIDAFRK